MALIRAGVLPAPEGRRWRTIARGIRDAIAPHWAMLRLTDSRAYLGMAILGASLGGGCSAAIDTWPTTTISLALSCVLYLGFAFSINNCFDRESDRLNPAKIGRNPAAIGTVGLSGGVILAAVAGLGGLCLACLASANRPAPLLLYISLLVVGASYSVPPVRLKGVPVLDLVSHGLGFGVLLFLYGFCATSTCSLTPRLIIVTVSVFLCSIFFEIRNHLDDLDMDKTTGTMTTACWLGREGTEKLLKLFLFSHLSVLFLLVWLNAPAGYLAPVLLMFILIITPVLGRRVPLVRAVDVFTILVYGLVGLLEVAGWFL